MSEQYPVDREALLSPTLGSGEAARPIYSTRAQFLTAFLGGPFAIILFSGLNALNLGRLGSELWRYILAMLASGALVIWGLHLMAAPQPPAWGQYLFGDQFEHAVRWTIRGFGLAVWFLLWLPHRRYHRAAEVMGVAPASPWGPAIACIVAAFVIRMGFGAVALAVAG